MRKEEEKKELAAGRGEVTPPALQPRRERLGVGGGVQEPQPGIG